MAKGMKLRNTANEFRNHPQVPQAGVHNLQPGQVEAVIMRMPIRTGLGQDSLEPEMLRNLTWPGLCAVKQLLNKVSRELVMHCSATSQSLYFSASQMAACGPLLCSRCCTDCG